MASDESGCCRGCARRARLHLGNYLGALDNWVTLQDDYDCFYFVADWHVAHRPRRQRARPRPTPIEMAADWLGRRPRPRAVARCSSSRWCRSTPSCTCCSRWSTPVSWLERVPTYKEMVEQPGSTRRPTACSATRCSSPPTSSCTSAQWVPVGDRPGAARRAHPRGGAPLQQHVAAGLPGAAGQAHRDPQGAGHRRPQDVEVLRQRHLPVRHRRSTITRKVRPMVTDPARKRRTDPGNPDVCPVFDLHRIFTPEADRERGAPTGCRTAGIGCLDCKGVLLEHMLPPLAADPRAPPALRREPGRRMVEILHEGSRRARAIAQADDGRGARRGEARRRERADERAAEAAPGTHRSASSLRGPARSAAAPLPHRARSTSPRLPVRTITDQYLAHLEAMQFRDLETAGAFMVMAATLIYLKSKLLLPPDDDGGRAARREGERPRQELAERLREYARVKAHRRLARPRARPSRRSCSGRPSSELPPPEDVPLEDLSVHLLERALQPAHRGAAAPARPARSSPTRSRSSSGWARSSTCCATRGRSCSRSVAGGERIRAEWW